MKQFLLTIILILSFAFTKCYSQNETHQVLIISEYGEKSPNSANWSISGENIKVFGEKVNIHPSVFENLLLQGNVILQASSDKSKIEIESPINVDAKTSPLFTIISSASIRVNASLNLNGGHLHLKALGKDKTQIVVNEKINVSAENGVGGNVFMEADEIELLEKTKLLATGSYGGGNILVGGDWQGGASEENRVFEDPNKLMQATKVIMHAKAIIDASATENGNGGTVVLWSDIKNPTSVTKAHGTIYAKGGSRSGEGGMIETSGFELLISG